MSDNLLLTSLWLVPLIGLVAVLILPKQAERAVKWVALGFTSLTFRHHARRAGGLPERGPQGQVAGVSGSRTTSWWPTATAS